MLRVGKSILFTLFMAFYTSVWSQGQYDVQVVVTSIDCVTMDLCIEIQIKATSSTTNFNVADQNYRLTFSPNLANPVIDQELTISGFVVSGPFASLYDPHTLTGTSGNLLSYNVILAGGDGYLLEETTWVSVGRVCFDIIDTNGCFSFDWNEPGVDFPPVIIVGKDMGVLFGATPGNFIDDSQSCNGQPCSDPPMAADDTFATTEDMPVSDDVSLNDIEPDGDNLVYSTTPVTPPLNGMVTLANDGTFTYTPSMGFTGVDSFSYEVCDTDLPPLCDTATVVINVADCSSLPGLTFTPDPCDFTVSITADDVGQGAMYSWDFGPGTTPGTATGIGPHDVEFPASGTQFVDLTVVHNGCNITTSLPVTVTDALTTAPVVANESCFAADDGSVDLNVSGGTGPYTFIWNDGQTTEIATGLEAGNYTTIIQDANGCFETEMTSISQPPELFASASETQSILCGGTPTGEAFVAGAGGIGPLSYLWDNGETSQTATMLLAGAHTVTVFDNTGCGMETTVNISENPPIVVSAMETQPVSCFGLTDGSASVTASGGIAPLTYAWSNGSTTTTANGLAGGLHSITVTDDIGCTMTADVTITQPALLTASASEDQSVSCNGSSDGQATATPSGGTMPYTFLWDNGSTGMTANNLSAGPHSITITDNNNCTTTTSVSVSEPALLSASASQSQPVSCNGGNDGQAVGMAGGGTAPYSFLWDNGETSALATNLNAGVHIVTVTDNNGCAQTDSAIISEPASLTVSVSEDNPVSCAGGNDGAATISPSGGTAPYTFAWDNGVTGSSATDLTAGFHQVTVTDANNCSATSSINISELPALTATHAVSQNVQCGGESTGIVDLTISGGTAPYAYSWSGASSGTANEANAGTFSISSLPAGSYDFNITDVNNCVTNIMGAVITEPAPVTVSLNNTTPSSCSLCNATADVAASGGTGPYTYLWDNGNTSDTPADLCPGFNNITVTDASGCTGTAVFNIPSITDLSISNFTVTPVSCFGGTDGGIIIEVMNGMYPYTYQWSNGIPDTDSIITNVASGMYQVTVTDQSGCPVVENIFVTEPPAFTASIIQDINIDCNGNNNAAVTVSPMGGSGPYTFLWDANAADQTTAQATGLSAMAYMVTVTDNNSCTATASVNITEPSVLTASAITDQNVSCSGSSDGSATMTPAGGTLPYTFLWDNGESSATATNLNAATHSITVTDSNNCTAVTTVDITEPLPLTLSLALNQDVSCFGGNDGSLTATPSDGTPSYTFLWDNGETNATAINLTAGMHIVTVTDNNGCTLTGEATVGEPVSQVTASVNADQQISCFGANDGVATVTGMGGTPGYTFAWDNGATDATVSNLGPGTQNITITDANGCSATTSVDITEPAAITLSTNVLSDVACFGEATGSASVVPSGGTPAFTFLWESGSTTDTATGLLAGMHPVTVTDANNCSATASVSITEPASALSLTVTPVQDVTCFGGADGSASATTNGGTPSYTYLWDNGETDASATALNAGNHDITVTDNAGCSITGTVMIVEPSQLGLTLTVNQDVSCVGDLDGSISATASGGTPGYTYLWDNGETTDTATGLSSGNHSVTVTDNNGCTITAGETVGEPANPLTATINLDMVISCAGANDAIATVTGTGGTPGYTFAWDNGSTDATATGLSPGFQTVTVSDANGCSATSSIEITDPAPFDIMAGVVQDVDCFGNATGSASVTPMGGTPAYTYLWDNGSTDDTATGLSAGANTVTVTDANGCFSTAMVVITEPASAISTSLSLVADVNCFGESSGSAEAVASGGSPAYTFEWDNGETNAVATNLDAGNHAVTVTDTNGCSVTGTIMIGQPSSALNAQTTLDQSVSCFGVSNGEGTVTSNGGTAPYSYLWNTGETTQTATALDAGLNSVTVTDQNGCSVTASLDAGNPDPLLASDIIENPVSCFGSSDGSATAEITGGNEPYTYAWSNGQTGQTATGLAPGNYLLTVTDVNGCMVIDIPVTITEPAAPLSVVLSGTNVTCWNGDDGTALATASGGTPNYTYSWNNGAADSLATGLDAGSYTVTVTDGNGCLVIETLSLDQPEPISAQLSAEPAICFGDANGSISVDTAFGGNGPYIFSLDGLNFQTDSLFSGIPGGTYQVTIQDVNGCEIVQQTFVDQPEELTVNLGADLIVELGDSIRLQPEINSTDSLSYAWDPLLFLNCLNCPDPVVRPLDDIMYTLIVTDETGCTASDDIFIDVDKNRNVYIPNAFTPNDDGVNDVFMIYGGKGVSNIRSLVIFDRWGEQVFEAANFNPGNTAFGWNGTLNGKGLNPGVFVFFAEVEFDDGVVIPYKGDVTLVK